MQLRYSFRVYPEPGQRIALAKAFGCARVVFNDGIRLRQKALAEGLPYIRDSELQTLLTVIAKAAPERAWLAEVSADVLIQSIRDMHLAYRNFFNSLSGKRKGAKLGAPRYRSRKDTRQAIRFTRNGFRLRGNGRLFLAKIGEIPVRWSRDLPSEPSSVTVIKDSAGRYFASFVVECGDPKPLPEADNEIGLDLGLNAYAVDSQGRVIANPRFLRNHERRLRKVQKALSRKEKGSSNRKKARVRVARAHAHGRAERLNACGAQVRPGLVRAPRYEAGTHRGAQRVRAKPRTERAEGVPSLLGGEDVNFDSPRNHVDDEIA